jgi:hypothetical protein
MLDIDGYRLPIAASAQVRQGAEATFIRRVPVADA